MPKVAIDLVRSVLERNSVDVRVISEVIKDLEVEMKNEAELAEGEKEPKVKKQFVILASDPEGKLDGVDLAGWVLQMPEEESPATATTRLAGAVAQYNATRKGRRRPISTVGEAFEALPGGITKEHQIWVKTKEPVLVVRTTNELPDAPADPESRPSRPRRNRDDEEDEATVRRRLAARLAADEDDGVLPGG